MARRPKLPKVSITWSENRARWDALLGELGKAIKGSYVKVGMLGAGSSRGPGEQLTNTDIAVVHEFGAPSKSIPERSFIRRTFDRERAQLEVLLQQFAQGIYDGKITLSRALGLIGLKLSADIKNTVTRGDPIPPPNSPRVLARKEALRAEGSIAEVRTLIDTGRMIAALTFQVFLEGRPEGAPPPAPKPARVKDPKRVAAGKKGAETRRRRKGQT